MTSRTIILLATASFAALAAAMPASALETPPQPFSGDAEQVADDLYCELTGAIPSSSPTRG